MSLLNLLGLAGDSASTQSPAPVSATVREIVRELRAMEPGAARYLAAFAYILSRAAHADLEISAAETRTMEAVVVRHGHLPAEQARLVVEIVKGRALLFASTEDFLVTREFKTISTVAQRIELLHCLFAVSAADDSITIVEEEAIRGIANELGFDHRAYIDIRSNYSGLREVMRNLPGDLPPEDRG